MRAPHPFTPIPTLREQARAHLEGGAVTAGYSADRSQVLQLLNAALASELVCVLRYRCDHYLASGIHGKSIGDEFLAHSNEELAHADLLAARIVQLGGEPDLSPDTLSARSHAEYLVGGGLRDMIRENLVAERIAVDSYREMIRYLETDDPATSLLLKQILTVEEAHAEELADLLRDFPASTGH